MTLSEDEKRAFIKEYSRIAASKELRSVQNIDEIKAVIENNKQHFSLVPRKLYKYRRFDEKNYTYDSINNDRLYLSRADQLDDAFEASLRMDASSPNDDNCQFDRLFLRYIHYILDFYDIEHGPVDAIYEESKLHPEEGMTYFLGKLLSFLTNDLSKDIMVFGQICNYVIQFNVRGGRDELMKRANSMLSNALQTGICSLTTNKSSQIMWEYYADHYKGCCVEYSIDDDDYSSLIDLVPVVYSHSRPFSAIDIAVDLFLGESLYGEEHALKEFTLQLFQLSTVKDPEWAFQNEWRIIGYPGYSVNKAPRISAIYLGHNVSETDIMKIVEIANRKHIPLFSTFFDYENTRINFREIANEWQE